MATVSELTHLLIFYFTGVQLIYSVVLVPGAQQSDPVIHIIFQIIFHYRLLQDIDYSSHRGGNFDLSQKISRVQKNLVANKE